MRGQAGHLLQPALDGQMDRETLYLVHADDRLVVLHSTLVLREEHDVVAGLDATLPEALCELLDLAVLGIEDLSVSSDSDIGLGHLATACGSLACRPGG